MECLTWKGLRRPTKERFSNIRRNFTFGFAPQGNQSKGRRSEDGQRQNLGQAESENSWTVKGQDSKLFLVGHMKAEVGWSSITSVVF